MNRSYGSYGFGGKTGLGFAEALNVTKEALKDEGFGILFEADLKATMREKLGIEHPPYVILGVCQPRLAAEALKQEPDLGLLLPCNVVLYEAEGTVWVKAIDPDKLLSLVGNPALGALAGEIRQKLERVLARIPD